MIVPWVVRQITHHEVPSEIIFGVSDLSIGNKLFATITLHRDTKVTISLAQYRQSAIALAVIENANRMVLL